MARILIIGIVFVALTVGCEKRVIKIDRSMQRSIDTSAAKQQVILRAELDSLCSLRMDSLVDLAVDSILNKRRGEIQKITRHD